jgi:hypothetical protein
MHGLRPGLDFRKFWSTRRTTKIKIGELNAARGIVIGLLLSSLLALLPLLLWLL